MGYRPQPAGWNTWDVQYHTGSAHLPSGVRLRFALAGADGTVADTFTWRHGLERLGHHTVDGRYAQVRVAALDTTLDLQFAGGGDVLDAVASAAGDTPADLVVIVDRMPGFDGALTFDVADGRRVVRILVAGQPWRLAVTAPVTSVDTSDDGVLRLTFAAADADPLCVHVGQADEEPLTAPAIMQHVASARGDAVATRMRTGGWLGNAGDAYTRSVTWNTIYAPDIDRVLTPTSRDFVCAEREGFYGRWALHVWDTFFTGLVAGWIDSSYALGIFRQILDQADERGMLPNRVSDERGRTDDRSQSPVGGITVLKAYLGSGLSDETRDRQLLEGCYDDLLRWHRWWPSARRGPFGLLAWGSDPIEGDPDSQNLEILIDRTKREGLDDSPMYDEVTWDPQTHTQNLADVGLNGLHVADAEAVAAIAELLGDASTAQELRTQAESARAEINRLLWDAEHGEYRNRWAGGEFSEHIAPTMLYPLLGDVPDAEQARSLVDHLLSPDVLGGKPPLPSVARNDSGFNTRYWRGRVWAPMAYLAVEGLRRGGFEREAREAVESLLELFLDEWDRHSHVRENYPIQPGEDVRPLAARSDGLMSWGSLLALLAFQEIADPRPEGWRFAHPGTPAELAGIVLGEGRLTVRAEERLTVALHDDAGRDDAPGDDIGGATTLLDTDPHVVVTAYQRTTSRVVGVATAHGSPGRVLVAPPPEATETVQVTIDSTSVVRSVRRAQLVEIDLPSAGTPTAFRLVTP
ncbi:MGH1-like glycoside hydrolase domain-containing protein [Phytoactinopolyspora halotolerans]|uniref:Mannosylglycerate hydrolase MGH1-like glycoside hydrolase domain-containing protein n=1 Tax=Phytoactinopolyspora halotolerans TaxID=1981512 RepID=A0A6L9S4L2_9ACTN|nr:trehalase family glycosidase [Phytoactinopolyspora halotolerans]NEE00086.1 hypothetical protein [Phytoactinopolyspora halotolerans]